MGETDHEESSGGYIVEPRFSHREQSAANWQQISADLHSKMGENFKMADPK
jgi:hypothetical protein